MNRLRNTSNSHLTKEIPYVGTTLYKAPSKAQFSSANVAYCIYIRVHDITVLCAFEDFIRDARLF